MKESVAARAPTTPGRQDQSTFMMTEDGNSLTTTDGRIDHIEGTVLAILVRARMLDFVCCLDSDQRVKSGAINTQRTVGGIRWFSQRSKAL